MAFIINDKFLVVNILVLLFNKRLAKYFKDFLRHKIFF